MYDCFKAREEDTQRLVPLSASTNRSEFQRDRDRILYSKEFRRLSGKTQVFITSFDDNTRTRLTHTLEVSQIACSIARALGLNTELTEAIALGHDVGHTPFGHVGERTLNLALNGCIPLFGYNYQVPKELKGFKHNLQGVRVVSQLEVHSLNEPGLNLTRYTMWGIANHTKTEYKKCSFCSSGKCIYKFKNNDRSKTTYRCCKGNQPLTFYEKTLVYGNQPILDDKRDWTFEGIIVGIADEIAQRHHDVEDGLFAGIIDAEEVVSKLKEKVGDEAKNQLQAVIDNKTHFDQQSLIISSISHHIVDYYIGGVINEAKRVFDDILIAFPCIKDSNIFIARKGDVFDYLTKKGKICSSISYGKELSDFDVELKSFLAKQVLFSNLAQSMDGKADFIIRKLIKAYTTNPQQLPDMTIARFVSDDLKIEIESPADARKKLNDELKNSKDKYIRYKLLRTICDFIAGMTDSFAYKQYDLLYGTKVQ